MTAKMMTCMMNKATLGPLAPAALSAMSAIVPLVGLQAVGPLVVLQPMVAAMELKAVEWVMEELIAIAAEMLEMMAAAMKEAAKEVEGALVLKAVQWNRKF